MTDAVLAKVLESARGPGGRHSPLYRWMWRHHTALSRQFSEIPPAWSALAETFAEEGLVDRTGKAPTAKTAQQTWRRVRAAKARAAAQKPDRRQGPEDGSEAERPAVAPGVRMLRHPPVPETAEAASQESPSTSPGMLARALRMRRP